MKRAFLILALNVARGSHIGGLLGSIALGTLVDGKFLQSAKLSTLVIRPITAITSTSGTLSLASRIGNVGPAALDSMRIISLPSSSTRLPERV